MHPKFGTTPLMEAAFHGRDEIVRQLIEHSAQLVAGGPVGPNAAQQSLKMPFVCTVGRGEGVSCSSYLTRAPQFAKKHVVVFIASQAQHPVRLWLDSVALCRAGKAGGLCRAAGGCWRQQGHQEQQRQDRPRPRRCAAEARDRRAARMRGHTRSYAGGHDARQCSPHPRPPGGGGVGEGPPARATHAPGS